MEIIMKKFIMLIVALLFGITTLAASAATFTQADLTGTWRMNMLRKGLNSSGTTPRNEWARARITIDASGVASCLSYTDSTGVTTCPAPFDMTFTMDETTGVITETGTSGSNAGTNHMTMTLNKNFIAQTATNGGGPYYNYQLMTAQKEVAGTSYSADDVKSKSLVYHQLRVGSDNEWEYGTATTDATGLITVTSATGPSGPRTAGTVGTFSLGSNGVITVSGGDPSMATFQGFLSDDKKTIVGTQTDSGSGYTVYGLFIFQITGQTYTPGTIPAQTSAVHMLGVGASNAAFWVHYTNTVDSGGVMTPSDWVPSNPGVTAPVGTYTGYITSSGTVTIDGNPTYHGQASHDGTFTVGTQTSGTGPYYYLLNVSTRASVCSSKKAKVNTDYFDTLQAAYNSAADGNTLQIQEYLFNEDVLLDRNITTILKGGYNCQYETNTGYTTVNGSITITNGTVTTENIIIK
jgi:hypothetical protein